MKFDAVINACDTREVVHRSFPLHAVEEPSVTAERLPTELPFGPKSVKLHAG